MRLCVTVIALFVTVATNSQNKDDITVINYTAKFVEEISLKQFDDHNTHLFYLSKHGEHFTKEEIIYIPTVMLFHNGEQILKIESGVTLKLPENTVDKIEDAIDEILENTF
jgi:glucan phosphoethanolaminetransferase (alkaline phosphatase superfamily)